MRSIIFFLLFFNYTVVFAQIHTFNGDTEPIYIEFKTEDSIKKYNNFKFDSKPSYIEFQSKIKKKPNIDKSNVKKEPETNRNQEIKISEKPNYYAVIIGISNYDFSNKTLRNLENPIKDARKLKTVLTEKYNFQNENIFFNANPKRYDILKTLEKVSKKIQSKDNLLIFYAGHGYWDKFMKIGYWLPANAKINDKSSWISNSTIRDYISAIPSKHTLLITDACFGGSILKTRSIEGLNPYAVSKIYQLPSRKAMTSGTLTKVPDESIFIKYLIKRLYENDEKFLSASQLFYSMQSAILNNSNTVPQLGIIQNTGDEGGDFIFIKKDTLD